MIKNLIILERKNKALKPIEFIFSNLGIFPRINDLLSKFFIWIKLKKVLFKKYPTFKKNSVKILFFDKFLQLRYKIPLLEYRERYIKLAKNGREILDYLEKHTHNFNKDYRNLDMHIIYENNLLVTQMWDFLEFYLSIQALLKNFEFENIFISEELEIIYKLFQFSNEQKRVNIYKLKRFRVENLLNKLITTIIISLSRTRMPFLKFYNKIKNLNKKFEKDKDLFDNKYIYNIKKPNIGFLYYSLTHKNVGRHFFEYLKHNKVNILEINPIPPKSLLNIKRTKHLRTKCKRILKGINDLYNDYNKKIGDHLFALYLQYVLEKISQQIEFDLITIDYIYKKIEENNLNLLIIFNDNSFLGKVSALICKNLKIPTLYIPHGGITETYILTFPRWCDIMILNSEIEKEFLLNEKLKPSIYDNRLLPIGYSYFKLENLEFIDNIQDIYNEEFNQTLRRYKFKILVALGYESNNFKFFPYSNFKIIKHLISVLKNQTEIKNYLLIIKLHPTDNIKRYESMFKNKRAIPIVFTNKIDIRNLIYSADLFLTTPSTTILQGILLKTPTVILDYYYTIGFYLYSDESIITTVHNQEELKKQIIKYLLDENFREKYIETTYNYGLKFCRDYDKENFQENVHTQLLGVIQKLIRK